MNSVLISIKTDAVVDRVWVDFLLDAQINDPMHTTPPENELKN